MREEIQWALNGLPQLAVNLRYEEQTSRAETIERIVAILRRLASGVTPEMVRDAYRACPCPGTALQQNKFVAEHINAALVAALGAK